MKKFVFLSIGLLSAVPSPAQQLVFPDERAWKHLEEGKAVTFTVKLSEPTSQAKFSLEGGAELVFPEHANFVAIKDKGVLLSPEEAASRVLAYLARSDFGSQPVADVRDA